MMKTTIFFCLSMVVARAGFCDTKVAYGSGYYCDANDSKYCKCKSKDGKRKCDKDESLSQDCTLRGDGWTCKYGGRCSAPPPPPSPNEICSDKLLSSTDETVKQCPVVGKYYLWENYYMSNSILNNAAQNAENEVEWFEDLRLQMLQEKNTTVNITSEDDIKTNFPNIASAWTDICEGYVKEYSCRAHIPECKSGTGAQKIGTGATAMCEEVCSKIDKCALDFYNMCVEEAKINTNLNCSSYAMIYPKNVVKLANGNEGRNCPLFCSRNQNDYVNDANSLASSMVVLFAMFMGAQF